MVAVGTVVASLAAWVEDFKALEQQVRLITDARKPVAWEVRPYRHGGSRSPRTLRTAHINSNNLTNASYSSGPSQNSTPQPQQHHHPHQVLQTQSGLVPARSAGIPRPPQHDTTSGASASHLSHAASLPPPAPSSSSSLSSSLPSCYRDAACQVPASGAAAWRTAGGPRMGRRSVDALLACQPHTQAGVAGGAATPSAGSGSSTAAGPMAVHAWGGVGAMRARGGSGDGATSSSLQLAAAATAAHVAHGHMPQQGSSCAGRPPGASDAAATTHVGRGHAGPSGRRVSCHVLPGGSQHASGTSAGAAPAHGGSTAVLRGSTNQYSSTSSFSAGGGSGGSSGGGAPGAADSAWKEKVNWQSVFNAARRSPPELQIPSDLADPATCDSPMTYSPILHKLKSPGAALTVSQHVISTELLAQKSSLAAHGLQRPACPCLDLK